jgi:hypothetical protein
VDPGLVSPSTSGRKLVCDRRLLLHQHLDPQLHAALNGRVITPDDPACDQARAIF